MSDLGDVAVHVWQIGMQEYPRLSIGIPDNKVRPIMWITLAPEQNIILASFHGDEQANAAIHFLNSMLDQINHVIEHYAKLHGETTDAENEGDGPEPA